MKVLIWGGNLSEFREQNYSYIAMENYCELLDKRADLEKQLLFGTSEGLLTNEKLAAKLLEKEKIKYNSLPGISYNWIKNRGLYEHLCAAFLRENYLLKINMRSYSCEAFIFKKEKELSDDYKKIFPACFFLPEINNNCDILTIKEAFGRYACNEYHRLSQFILKNGKELNKYVPGIFKELLRVLAEEKGDELIGNVNGLLENLRKFPGGVFEVPEELFLSKKDLL